MPVGSRVVVVGVCMSSDRIEPAMGINKVGVSNAFDALGDPEKHAKKILIDPRSSQRSPDEINAGGSLSCRIPGAREALACGSEPRGIKLGSAPKRREDIVNLNYCQNQLT